MWHIIRAEASYHKYLFLAFLALYDGVFAILSWASFEYVITE